MTDYHAVLVLDGECPFCSAAASPLRRLRGVGAVRWDDESIADAIRTVTGGEGDPDPYHGASIR